MKNGLLDRVGRIEAQLNDIVKNIQAVARVVGTDEVVAELALGLRQEMAGTVVKVVQEGKLGAVTEIGEGSLVVGQEMTKDGQVVHPGRFQVFIRELTDDQRQLFLGKKVGEQLTLPNGNSVLVQEAYDQVDPAAKSAPKRVRKPRAKAAPVNAGPFPSKN